MLAQRILFFVSLVMALANTSFAQPSTKVDVCIYGGTSAGVMAAYTAKRMGKSVLLIEPGRHLGGLTSGGLGYTDIGNKYAISGIALDFYRRIGKHYGKFEQWIFEPHVAENLFKEYIDRAKAEVLYAYRLKAVNKIGTNIKDIILESSSQSGIDRKIEAKMFMDCTYEGDLMAKAGVSYIVGREANAMYNETVCSCGTNISSWTALIPIKSKENQKAVYCGGSAPKPWRPRGLAIKKCRAILLESVLLRTLLIKFQSNVLKVMIQHGMSFCYGYWRKNPTGPSILF